ncbi:MAG: hypothetical protein AAFQ94_09315 [Bacteroidota bacterium]
MEQEVFKTSDFTLWVLLGKQSKAESLKRLRELGFDTKSKLFYSKQEILQKVEEQESEKNGLPDFESDSDYNV